MTGRKRLSLGDTSVFLRYLRMRRHELSVFTFPNIFLWSALFDIRWSVIRGSLCVFFRDKTGCFLYLPPMGVTPSTKTIEEAFAVMDRYNPAVGISRIENLEQADLALYRGLGYRCAEKSPEYLCRRQDMAALTGERFKSKRASANYFVKHHSFEYRAFSPRDREPCLRLYRQWEANRRRIAPSSLYRWLLDDSFRCLSLVVQKAHALGITGRVVTVDNELKGFTFGFPVNPETFCVLYEITDLGVKGLAQFIFRAFCAEMEEYDCINIMDDSGLENLKVVKESYRPFRRIPAYIATRA